VVVAATVVAAAAAATPAKFIVAFGAAVLLLLLPLLLPLPNDGYVVADLKLRAEATRFSSASFAAFFSNTTAARICCSSRLRSGR
jgi:hypothetical protein